MKVINSIFIFIANHLNRIKRKWMSLPLLFISPVIFITVLIVLLAQFVQFDERTLEVGVVNNDDSEETAFLVEALSESSDMSGEIDLIEMNESEAEKAVESDNIVSYIIFPDQFYQNMMSGVSSELAVVGNAARPLESHLVSEVVDTVVRYIRTSQSSILTINHYGREFEMDTETRHEMVFQSFVDYFLQVLSSGNMMDESEVNSGTDTGSAYFIVNGMFIIITLWILMMHITLTRDVSSRIEARLKLLGVTHMAFSTSKLIVVTGMTFFISAVFIFITGYLEVFQMIADNYMRVLLITALHITATALLLEITDLLIPSEKLKLLAEILIVLGIIFFAGAVIPAVYFPIYFIDVFEYIYSYESLLWIENIMLNGRYTFDIHTSAVTCVVLTAVFIVSAYWKERRGI